MCFIKRFWILFLILSGLAFITNVVKAEEQVYYTAGPAYSELAPTNIHTIDNLSAVWLDVDALKDVIDTFHRHGPAAASSLFNRYKKLGSAIVIDLGTYPVQYIYTYNKYYIFTVEVK